MNWEPKYYSFLQSPNKTDNNYVGKNKNITIGKKEIILQEAFEYLMFQELSGQGATMKQLMSV